MDFDFLDRSLIDASRDAIQRFKSAIEGSKPSDKELELLGQAIRPYDHARTLPADFRISAVDGSGEYPVLQQDMQRPLGGGSLFHSGCMGIVIAGTAWPLLSLDAGRACSR